MEEIEINIKNTTIVKPSQETPKRRMWMSNADLVVSRIYIPNVYFYRCNGSSNFFDPKVVKDALGRALILYYPASGRLKRDIDGRRIEIDCNEGGVLFMEAKTASVVNDFGDFSPTIQYKKLIPSVECSGEISSSPLLLVQFTYFKCGGVALGVAVHHLFADAFSIIHFTNTWADMARGLFPDNLPALDREILCARDPPSPKFHHLEYEASPTLVTPRPTTTITTKCTFNITRDQINALMENSKDNENTTKDYTSTEILMGHIWRCVCKARGLSDSQPSKLYIPVDARSKLKPNLAATYFGNAIFMASIMATGGDITSNPASYAANKVHESLERMDDEYLRSALDYIELQADKDALVRGSHTYECPNLVITSWANMPIFDADFGWGRPTFMGPCGVKREGVCHLVPTAMNDGGLSVIITLEEKHIQLFQTHFYCI